MGAASPESATASERGGLSGPPVEAAGRRQRSLNAHRLASACRGPVPLVGLMNGPHLVAQLPRAALAVFFAVWRKTNRTPCSGALALVGANHCDPHEAPQLPRTTGALPPFEKPQRITWVVCAFPNLFTSFSRVFSADLQSL